MPQTTYRLRNALHGASSPLSVNSSTIGLQSAYALRLQVDEEKKGLEWTFSLWPESDRYHICTTYNTDEFCLDVINTLPTSGGSCPENCTIPHLAPPGYYSGQQWELTADEQSYYKLSNDFTGHKGWYLGTNDQGEASMSEGSSEQQRWELEIVTKGASTISGATFPTSSSHPAKASITGSTRQAQGTSSDISLGAKVGIGVGAGVAATIVIIGIVALLMLRKNRQRQAADMQNTEPKHYAVSSSTYHTPSKQLRAGELEGSYPGRPQRFELSAGSQRLEMPDSPQRFELYPSSPARSPRQIHQA